jgi:hypothetical protein
MTLDSGNELVRYAQVMLSLVQEDTLLRFELTLTEVEKNVNEIIVKTRHRF